MGAKKSRSLYMTASATPNDQVATKTYYYLCYSYYFLAANECRLRCLEVMIFFF